MLELIDPRIGGHVQALHDQFQSNQPFRHLVIDGFLRLQYCQQLICEFPAFDTKRALNEFGEVGRKAVFQNLAELGPSYECFDRMLRAPEFLSFLSQITGIRDLLYDPEYVGGGTHENLNGQDLDPHVDFNYHPKTKLHRRLNLLLFLNGEWKDEWGGLLELHLNPWLPPEQNQVKTILPIANRCVLFETTEHSWHGFTKIQLPEEKNTLSRRSIAVYFYTKERPSQSTAPEHSTVYVQRPLPAYITAGYTLQEEDAELIRELITRRDQQIKFLYEREVHFSSTLSRIARSPTYRLSRLLTWPLRKLRDLIRGKKP